MYVIQPISGVRHPSDTADRLVLYMIYYPQNLKYVEVYADNERDNGHDQQSKITKVKTDAWNLSITLSWVVFIHM